jgi:hypothetical protein
VLVAVVAGCGVAGCGVVAWGGLADVVVVAWGGLADVVVVACVGTSREVGVACRSSPRAHTRGLAAITPTISTSFSDDIFFWEKIFEVCSSNGSAEDGG